MISSKPICWKVRNRPPGSNQLSVIGNQCSVIQYSLNGIDEVMEYVENYKDLEVYRASRQLAKEIFSITKSFPRDEMYSLTDQIRRSSRSVGAQIAEAWAKRKYEKHFISKLTDADGE